jgi:hypothetical protein
MKHLKARDISERYDVLILILHKTELSSILVWDLTFYFMKTEDQVFVPLIGKENSSNYRNIQ